VTTSGDPALPPLEGEDANDGVPAREVGGGAETLASGEPGEDGRGEEVARLLHPLLRVRDAEDAAARELEAPERAVARDRDLDRPRPDAGDAELAPHDPRGERAVPGEPGRGLRAEPAVGALQLARGEDVLDGRLRREERRSDRGHFLARRPERVDFVTPSGCHSGRTR
jgi:hypothetical protein